LSSLPKVVTVADGYGSFWRDTGARSRERAWA